MSKLAAVTISMVLVSLALGLAAHADGDGVMYYRGYFNAQTVEVPFRGFVYSADPTTVQPSFYYNYRTAPVSLAPLQPAGGMAARTGNPGWGTQGGLLNGAPGSRPVVLVSPVPLPGQYWYEDPSQYSFSSPVNLGWPYGPRR